MASFQPCTISNGSFAFSRATVAVLLWCSIIFRIKAFVWIVFAIMILSAYFKVDRAPLILLYKYTVDKVKPSQKIVVNRKGIFFLHIVGAVFSILCLFMLYFSNPTSAWIITTLFAILQTLAALFFCSALKLYDCMVGGRCCRVEKKIKKTRGKN